MADVFLSYERSAQPTVELVARLLSAGGLTVWWDGLINPGVDYEAAIDAELEASLAVVVFWTAAARNSDWVKSEANSAYNADKIISVRLDDSPPPRPHEMREMVDLIGWAGRPDHPQWQRLMSRLQEHVAARRATTSTATGDKGALLPLMSDQELALLSRTVSAATGVTIERVLTRGEVSIVFQAKRDYDDVAVKVVRDTPLTQADRLAIEAAVEASQRLHPDPTLVHNRGVKFDGQNCFIVMDMVRGVGLDDLVARSGALGRRQAAQVLHDVCHAVHRAHTIGMRHLRIVPGEVFYEDGRARISPINFADFLGDVDRRRRKFLIDNEISPYTAPEAWHPIADFVQRMALQVPVDSDEAALALARSADQYALGMLGWFMLSGREPFTFHCAADAVRYLQEAPRFSAQIREAPWRWTAPELAWVLSRMVAYEPSQRWPDLGEIAQHVGAMCGRVNAVPYLNTAMRSFESGVFDEPAFFQSFYDRLRQRSERARVLFTDEGVQRQIPKLKSAIGRLLRFQPGLERDPELDQYVASHRRMHLRRTDFDAFVQCLLDTLAQYDTDAHPHGTVGVAWRVVLWPGVHYMAERLDV